MRSRERLIEVMESVNRVVVGFCVWSRLDYIAGALRREQIPVTRQAKELAESLADHASPHIRELASEALHYLTEDNGRADQG